MNDAPKEYTLTFEVRPGYLYAHLASDKITVDIIRGYVEEIVAKSGETGLDRILLYRDIPAILTEGEVFHTVSDSLEALRGKQLALVNPYSDIEKPLRFGMTVGQNRGGNYASFDTVEAAEVWLLK